MRRLGGEGACLLDTYSTRNNRKLKKSDETLKRTFYVDLVIKNVFVNLNNVIIILIVYT